MDMSRYSHVYFIGIGGIGMSAIARYCRHAGLNVSGYDRTPSPVTEALEKEGIPVHFDSNVSRRLWSSTHRPCLPTWPRWSTSGHTATA